MPRRVWFALVLGVIALVLVLLAFFLQAPALGLAAIGGLLLSFYVWDHPTEDSHPDHHDLPTFVPRISPEEAKQAGLTPVQADLVVNPALKEVASLALQKNIRIINTLVRLMPEVYAEVHTARMVLSALLLRAIENSPEGAEIIVHTEEDRDDILFTVEDQSPGFEENDWLLWAARPWQVRVSGPPFSISQLEELISRMHGKLLIASEPGKGVALTIALPKANVLDD